MTKDMADAWPNMILLFPTKKKIAPTSTCTGDRTMMQKGSQFISSHF